MTGETLGEVRVLEVHEREGHVVHTCSAPLQEGSQVEGEIDLGAPAST